MLLTLMNDMSASTSVSPLQEFFSLLPVEMDQHLDRFGLESFRGRQLRSWVYQKLIGDVRQMTTFSAGQREKLTGALVFAQGQIERQQESSDGTVKMLLSWPDGQVAECVMIPDGERRTACISSQVGCPVGCKFCASGAGGSRGNLSAGRIVEQVFALNRMLQPAGARLSNIVFMGMGEPLANYAQVMQAVRILHEPECFNLSARRITISTVGVPQRMLELAGEKLPVNLAISLHAPTESLRRQLIPWAEYFALEEILAAGQSYFAKTGREITLEYLLLAEVNDRPEHARQLAGLCHRLRANVNLILYNEVSGLEFKRPKQDDVAEFQRLLREAGVNAHLRKSRGADIDAACGQLRRKKEL